MFGLFKRARERKASEAAERTARHHNLRLRLYETLDRLAVMLIDKHDLPNDEEIRIKESVDRIKQGIDLVLVEKIEWSDERIPKHLLGGAIIANSAEAYSSLAATLDKPELEAAMGSTEDREVMGHMCYQLGFSRDGSMFRPMSDKAEIST